MITLRQFVNWFTSPGHSAGSSRNRCGRRSIVVESLEIRTSLSSIPVAAPAHGGLLIDHAAGPMAAAHVQTINPPGSVSLTPDDTGMVGPKDPGGVEL